MDGRTGGWAAPDETLWRLEDIMVYRVVHGMIWKSTMRAKVMPDGRVSLPADLRRRHGLIGGGEVIVEDAGDAIVLRTLDQVAARAQELSRKLLAGKPGTSVDDFLADRARDAEAE
jgi:AbrB family looped-hinge helix DNA binding protein